MNASLAKYRRWGVRNIWRDKEELRSSWKIMLEIFPKCWKSYLVVWARKNDVVCWPHLLPSAVTTIHHAKPDDADMLPSRGWWANLTGKQSQVRCSCQIFSALVVTHYFNFKCSRFYRLHDRGSKRPSSYLKSDVRKALAMDRRQRPFLVESHMPRGVSLRHCDRQLTNSSPCSELLWLGAEHNPELFDPLSSAFIFTVYGGRIVLFLYRMVCWCLNVFLFLLFLTEE